MNRNRPTYKIVAPTQHWRVIGGVVRRDYIARTPTGELRVISLRDEVAA